MRSFRMRHPSSMLGVKKNVFYPISTGYNNYRCYHKFCTTHAEMDAINKLKPRDKCKKPIKVNIAVIRVNNLGNLCSSQPCHKCVDYMKTVAVNKGYKIKKIFYSTATGEIEHKLL